MSFLGVTPDVLTAASGNLENIGTSLRAAHAAAAAQTTAIVAPAADEVSEAITSLFGTAAQEYQALGAQAATFHESFVKTLGAAAGQYVTAEAANVQQTVAAVVPTTETINTPFGAISFTYGGHVPPSGTNGPFSAFANASTPLGAAHIRLNGNVLNGGTTYQATGGSLNWPGLVSFASAGAGPYVTGGFALSDSAHTFSTDLARGNYLGAAGALLTSPANFADAVLFGHQTITIPVDTSSLGGPTVDLSIPFGGAFASPQPITATWPTFQYTSGDTTYTVDGAHLAFGGTQVTGFFPFLLSAIGL
jgi:PE family